MAAQWMAWQFRKSGRNPRRDGGLVTVQDGHESRIAAKSKARTGAGLCLAGGPPGSRTQHQRIMSTSERRSHGAETGRNLTSF